MSSRTTRAALRAIWRSSCGSATTPGASGCRPGSESGPGAAGVSPPNTRGTHWPSVLAVILVVASGCAYPTQSASGRGSTWILWSESLRVAAGPTDATGFFYRIDDAYETHDACDQARVKKEKPQVPIVRWMCLPDTVDPGPRWYFNGVQHRTASSARI